jgi:hypothetical protein
VKDVPNVESRRTSKPISAVSMKILQGRYPSLAILPSYEPAARRLVFALTLSRTQSGAIR